MVTSAVRRSIALLLPLLLLAGCASTSDTGAASDDVTSAGTCRPFFLRTTVTGRTIELAKTCTSDNASSWSFGYETTINEQLAKARFVSEGAHKAELDKAIAGMVDTGVSRETTRFLRTKIDPALEELQKANTSEEKAAAEATIKQLLETHLLSLP